MSRTAFCLAAALLALAAVGGCSGPARSAPRTTTVEVSYADLANQKHVTRDVSLGVGGTLEVRLGSNASTGYQWSEQARIGDTSVLVQTGHAYVAPTGTQLGAPGTETWTFQALAAGTTTVVTTYGQPWEGGEKDSWTFTATVTVR